MELTNFNLWRTLQRAVVNFSSPFLFSSVLLFSQQQPTYTVADQKIVWVSGPAAPGDSVVVTGAFSAEPKTISIANNSTTIAPDYQGPESLVFKLPANLSQGVYSFKISDPAGTNLSGRINQPEIYWIMGQPSPEHMSDPGAQIAVSSAVKGEVIRIFGRNFGSNPQVVLRSMSGRLTNVAVASHNEWSISGSIPSGIGDGIYDVSVMSSNCVAHASACSGELQFTEVGFKSAAIRIHVTTYQPSTPRLVDAGACGVYGNGHDESIALQQCMNTLGQSATGNSNSDVILQFRPKTYIIGHTIYVPRHIYLRGAGQASTILRGLASDSPAKPLIAGQSNFGISQMTIEAHPVNKIVGVLPPIGGHILIDHVTIDAFPADTAPTALPDEATQLRLSAQLGRGDKDTLNLNGDDIRIVNSQIISNGRALIIEKSHGVYLSGDVISDGPYGWYNINNSADVIFEHSRINGVRDLASGGSYSASEGASENFYTDGNSYERMPAANGEAFTSDGPGGAYFGALSATDATHLELASDPNWKNRDWRNASVAIVSGRGAGQYRLIRAFSGREIDIEKPFDISLDRSSVVTIIPTQRHYIFVNNRVTDAGVGLQFYGTNFESVIADNTVSRASGIFVRAARYGDGIEPNLFVQILDNTILRRGTFKNGPNNPNVNDLSAVQVWCVPPSLSLGIVVRGNQLSTEAAVKVRNRGDSVHGIVIERNVAANPVQVEQPSPRVILRQPD
jgi:hypothetical protein